MGIPVGLLKRTDGPWDRVKGYLRQDLEKIEQGLARVPETPSSLPLRIMAITTSPTPSIDVDVTDVFVIARQATNILSMSTGRGTPIEGQLLDLRIFDDGTPRTITWGADFASTESGTLPTTTVPGEYLYVQVRWNSVSSTWDCVLPAAAPTAVPASSITGGQMLSKTNDTNVTLTVGGTPATALLKAVSLALGWTGLLGLARGGTGVDLSASGGATELLAQDASHVVSARSLVAADIPSLSTSILSDYATGSWTPADGSGAALSLSGTNGQYVRLGRLVLAIGTFVYPATANGSNARISGLPFNANAGVISCGGFVYFSNYGSGVYILLESNATFDFFDLSGTQLTNANLSGKTFRVTCVYQST